MKTAMQEAIDKVSFIINMLHDTPDEMYMPHVIDLLKANLNELLEKEKEQIIDAWIATDNKLQRLAAEEYYNQTYNQNK
jgi:predicted AAA+ superfamily ATPase